MMNYKTIFSLIGILSICLACQETSETTNTQEETTPNASTTAFEDPPAWAKEAIWYQIFPESFRNGDPTNDPTPEDMQGGYPGFVPDNWELTPWTQDWYAPDGYFAEVTGKIDMAGNAMTNFGQLSRFRRYGGDLQGVLDKLDYLDSLGITAIYFNPLNDAPSNHKYDARHWRHIDRNFGPSPKEDVQLIAEENPVDPATWKMTGADKLFVSLINKLHERGIRVIMDYSWNHTGVDFWAWKDLVNKQAESAFADWYWVEKFDDPKTPENEFSYRGWFGVKDLPEIKETEYMKHAEAIEPFEGNLATEATKQHIFHVVKRWLDPNGDGDPSDGVDGFRLDVAAELPMGFWRDFRKHVRSINPDTYLIGEVWWEQYPDKLLNPKEFLKGDVFDAVMNYRWYRAARHFFNQAPDEIPVKEFVDSLNSLRKDLRGVSNYAMMNLAASHDSPRVGTSLFNKNKYKYQTEPNSNPDYKIHKPDPITYQTLRLLLAHQYTYIGAPHIWAGDEMGMWGADMGDTRKPLIWSDYDFSPEKVHPTSQEKPIDEVKFNATLYGYYSKLAKIRKAHPALIHGDIDFVLIDNGRKVLAYSRFYEDQEVIALFNTGDEPLEIVLPAKLDATYTELLNNINVEQEGKQLILTLEGRSAAILAPK